MYCVDMNAHWVKMSSVGMDEILMLEYLTVEVMSQSPVHPVIPSSQSMLDLEPPHREKVMTMPFLKVSVIVARYSSSAHESNLNTESPCTSLLWIDATFSCVLSALKCWWNLNFFDVSILQLASGHMALGSTLNMLVPQPAPSHCEINSPEGSLQLWGVVAMVYLLASEVSYSQHQLPFTLLASQ